MDISGPGRLIYKCRRCGKTSDNTHVPNGVASLAQAISGRKSSLGESIPMTTICTCTDGGIGIADLVGFESEGLIEERRERTRRFMNGQGR